MTTDYKVADINLADWGRKEINIAENGGFLIIVAGCGQHHCLRAYLAEGRQGKYHGKG